MTDTTEIKHTPLPKETSAFYCGSCGAVSLDQNNICNPAGKLTKADWCGSKDQPPAKTCQNLVNNARYICKNCGKSSVNAALLCEPEKMPLP
ncbi:MAG: hypothetical protein JRJ27_03685 [Deltaproteobacteria bacterium]|nr:hypothetical protein [Deltaproteobacteria bacterium]